MVVLDGGGAFMPPLRSKSLPAPQQMTALEQRRLKGRLIADAWRLGGIDAVALSSADWQLGLPFYQDLAKQVETPFLAANLKCGGEAPFPAHKVIDSQGRRIGVVGVTEGPVEGCEVGDITESIRAAVAEMGDVDVTIALVPLTVPNAFTGLLDEVAVDLVVDGRGGHSAARLEKLGTAWSLAAGSRGKSMGTARLEWREGATGWAPHGQVGQMQITLERTRKRLASVQQRLATEHDPARKERWKQQAAAYEMQITNMEGRMASQAGKDGGHSFTLQELPLNPQIVDHAETRALVDAAKLKMSDAAPPVMAKGEVVHRAPPDSKYAGSDVCQSCHATQHAQWLTTKHATAYDSLVEDRRHMDDTCWFCHVTGGKQETGPQSPAEVGGFRDVQCESCHGPAAAHAENPADASVRPVADVPQSNCVHCHDGIKDEGRFDWETYRPKIVHSEPAL